MMESRATHPSRPLIIPIFIPHQGCRHHCVFCNQRTLTGRPSKRVAVDWIAAEVKRYLKASKNRPSTVQISFYGGTFLGLERHRMVGLLEAASTFVASGAVDSLRFSTRPDTVSPETLAPIRPFPVSTV